MPLLVNTPPRVICQGFTGPTGTSSYTTTCVDDLSDAAAILFNAAKG